MERGCERAGPLFFREYTVGIERAEEWRRHDALSSFDFSLNGDRIRVRANRVEIPLQHPDKEH